MDFKKLVMHDTENRYQDMANGTTVVPFADMVTVSDYNSYNGKRNDYYRRLDKEKSEFNSAITQIRQTRDSRLEREGELKYRINAERRGFIPCKIVSIIGIALMFVLVIFGLQNGGKLWAKEILIPAMGFENFFDFDGVGQIPFFVSLGIAAVLEIIFFIWMIVVMVKDGDSEWGNVIFGFIIIGALLLGLLFLAIRLLMVGISYLIWLCINQYVVIVIGAISATAIMIIGKKFTLKRNKFKVCVNVVFILAITAVCYYIGNEFANGNSLEYIIEEIISNFENLIGSAK